MIINNVAKKYNISVRTLRYYEEIGLITSTRNKSNVRIFSEKQLSKIELILFFKHFNFKLTEIKSIVNSSDSTNIKSLFQEKNNQINSQLRKLQNDKQIITSVLKTFGSADISKHNILEFMKEQIYFQNKNERLINMKTSTKDIIIEIGENLIPCALSEDNEALLPSIKNLRAELKKTYEIDLDLIRVRDNIKVLSPNQYQILHNDNIIIKKEITSDNPIIQSQHIITQLKANIV